RDVLAPRINATISALAFDMPHLRVDEGRMSQERERAVKQYDSARRRRAIRPRLRAGPRREPSWSGPPLPGRRAWRLVAPAPLVRRTGARHTPLSIVSDAFHARRARNSAREATASTRSEISRRARRSDGPRS